MTQLKKETPDRMTEAWRRHERRWKDNLFVYAVVSRRSRGVSVGLNLNPDRACNFNCIYCQVNRHLPAALHKVDLRLLEEELNTILRAEQNGSLYQEAPFNVLTRAEQGVRDIAFSGDGEPTAYARFEDAVRIAAGARRRFGLNSAKLVLLTNAANLHKPSVRAALKVMDENNGEIWAKLDAGSEEYFRIVNRTKVPLKRILDNILSAARIRPVVIQSLWFRIDGDMPQPGEIEAYCSCLNGLVSSGAQIKAVQLYTIARDPADAGVTPLSAAELNAIASTVRRRIPAPLEVFP